jgi:hypothetical protein
MHLRALPLAALLVMSSSCITVGIRRSEGGPPSTFVKTTNESRLTRLIEVREAVAKPTLWRLLGEALGASHTIEVRDAQAGFMMTSWETTVVRDGVPDLRYRTRVVTRFLDDDWKQLQLRVEATWRSGDELDVGTDQALLDRTLGELTAKLGKQ